jgi:hypothetical protein
VNSQNAPAFSVLGYTPLSPDLGQPYFQKRLVPKPPSAVTLPSFIKPLPSRIGPDEVGYLQMKGALTLPTSALRNELLRAYVEFVHPYMPLLDLNNFLVTVDSEDGSTGKISLVLFQAVMFAGSAFVDTRHLHIAGYRTRKEARKDFFMKTRVSHCNRMNGPGTVSLTLCSCCTISTMNPIGLHLSRRCYS